MAQQFLPYNGSAATFVLPFVDKGGGEVDITPLRPLGLRGTFTRTTTATTIGATGLVIGVASGIPRSYYDPTTLEYQKYLPEGARTNVCLQSEVLTTTWTLVGAGTTLSSNAFVAPDGATTADKVIPANGTNGGINQAIAMASGSAWTISAFAKTDGLTTFQIYADDGVVTSSAQATFNTTTGAITSAAAVGGNWTAPAATAKQYPNGWWRFTLTFTTTTDAGTRIRLVANETGNGTTGILVWGAQTENASSASSYIPTTVATVTRNADVLTYLLTGWFNAATGTMFAAFTTQGAADAAAAKSAFAINDNTGNEEIKIDLSTALVPRFTVLDGGAAQANISIGAAVTTSVKVAGVYAVNDFSAARDGTLGTPDTSGTLPTVTQAMIGALAAGTGQMFGTISSIGYWPQRLPDNDLLYMTTNGVDFTVFTPAPTGGSSQTNIPAAFHARGQSDEQKRRSRVKFGLEKEVEKVIERVAENQVERQERDAQKRFEQLTRELEISGIEYQARYLELLNVQRERLIEARAEEVKKEIQAQADIASLVQSGQQAVDEHYSKIAQQLEQFAADSAQVNQQFIQMLQTFDHEYRAELLRYVPADLLRRRR